MSTGLENYSLHEPNPEIGITNDYKAGIICSKSALTVTRAVVKLGINLNSPDHHFYEVLDRKTLL